MAIIEFESGPQNFFEPGYIDDGYTLPNVSIASVACAATRVAGLQSLAGFYYEIGFIEAGMFGINSIEAQMSVQATKIHSAEISATEYFVQGYFVPGYVGQGMHGQLTVQGTRLRDVTATVVLTFEQTAVGNRNGSIDMFAFSDAAIAVTVNRLRDHNVSVNAEFSVAADFVVSRSADADVDAVFSAIIAGLRSRDAELQAQAAFSFESTSTKILQFDSQLISEITQSTQPDLFKDVTADLVVDTQITAQFLKIRDANLTGIGEATLTCAPTHTAENVVSLAASHNLQTFVSKQVTAVAAVNVTTFLQGSLTEPKLRFRFVKAQGNFLPTGTPGSAANGQDDIDSVTKKFGTGSLSLPATLTSGGARVNGIHSIALPAGQLDLPPHSFVQGQNEWEIYFWYRRTGQSTGNQLMIFCGDPTINYEQQGTGITVWGITHNLAFASRNASQTALSFVSPNITGFNFNQFVHIRIRKTLVNNIGRLQFFFDGGSMLNAVFEPPLAFVPLQLNQLNFRSALGSAVHIDDFRLRIGAGTGQQTTALPTTELAFIPSTDPSVLLPQTRVQLKFNGTLNDVEGIQTTFIGAAVLQSTANLLSSITVQHQGQVSITSEFNIAATVGTIEDIVLTAFADSTLEAVASLQQFAQADLASITAVSADISITVAAAADLSVETQTQCDASVIRNAIIATESVATKLAIVFKVGSVIVDLAADFAQQSQAVKTTDITANVTAESATVTNNDRLRDHDCVTQAQSAIAIVPAILRETSSDQFTVVSVTAQADRIRDAEIQLASVSSTSADASGSSIGVMADLTSTISVDVLAGFVRDAAAVTNVTADVTALAQKTTDIDIIAIGEFAQVVAEDRIRSVEIVTQSVAVKIVAAVKNITQDITGTAEFTVVAQAIVLADGSQQMLVSSTLVTEAVITASAAVDVAAVSTFAGDGTTNITGEAVVTAEFVLVIDAQVTVTVTLTAFADAVLNAAAQALREFDTTLTSTTAQTALFGKFIAGQATTQSESSLSASGGGLQNATIAIASAMQFAAAVRELRTDTIVFVLPGETRVRRIIGESRVHNLD